MDKPILTQNLMKEKTPTGQLLYLSVDCLKLHPQNIRRFYAPQDVAKMAGSIKAAGGVYQALLIVPIAAEPGCYHVLDGNMRLAGGKSLGQDCPPLKCEVISANQAEQLLAMAATTEFHFPKDPVSQAYHYHRLIAQEKLTVQAIVERTGVPRATIDKLLKLLELEPEIQQLITAGQLTADVRVTRALLDLPDSATRLRLAQRFARHETGIKAILQACRFVTRQAAQLTSQDALQRLEAVQAKKQQMVAKVLHTKFGRQAQRPHLDPEAARLIFAAADTTLCEDCRLTGLTENCYLCPGPRDFINAVVELLEADAPELQPQQNGQPNGKLTGEKARLLTLGRQLHQDFNEDKAA